MLNAFSDDILNVIYVFVIMNKNDSIPLIIPGVISYRNDVIHHKALCHLYYNTDISN